MSTNASTQVSPLLAKGRRAGRLALTLEQHLLDTEQAAGLVFRLDKRWGRNWSRFFKLEQPEARERFLLNLRVSALFHDIGKANEDFLRAVTVGGKVAQRLRHEHLSALVLCLPAVRQWLAQNAQLDVDVITAAVLSHHLKASSKRDPALYGWCQPRGTQPPLVQLHLQHREVISILARIGAVAGLQGLPQLPTEPWSGAGVWAQTWQQGQRFANDFQRVIRLPANAERRALLLAVKAGVIVADAVASGLVREGHVISDTDWIDKVVHSPTVGADEISTKIINLRGQQIAKNKGESFSLHPFQERVAEQGARVLLLAACAAGKTLAAWNWAERQARGREIGSVVFLYPTRGTATEGFRDYVGWAPEDEGALVHGTARYELEMMEENPSEAIIEKDYEKLLEDQSRLYALGLWSRRFFSATADQFLGFIEHNYTGLCLLPLLADSAVIIDEVHSFDQQMFASLVCFLETFDVPVLCMTATLPPARRQRLEACGLRVFPNEQERLELPSLTLKEDHPRYRLTQLSDWSAALREAAAAYRAGDRVLWVVNTVDRCQNFARLLQDELADVLRERQAKVLTYHSRFCLQDRKDRHNDTIKAFQQSHLPAIAVTTQVCEMSLDLDADVLISEIAPVPSLVQRFGRANRHLAKGDKFRARLYTYAPESPLPYLKDEIEVAAKFLAHLGGGDVSQGQMAEALEKFSLAEERRDASASFLEGGYYALRGAFRDTDELTTPCLLHTDLDAAKQRFDGGGAIDGFIISVPRKKGCLLEDYARPAWLPKYLNIADGRLYNTERGFFKPFND